MKTSPRSLKYSISLAALAAALFVLLPDGYGADASTQKEYESRLAKAQLDKSPENHKDLAAWCKRRYPEKYQFHQEAWNRHQFKLSEKTLPARPVPGDFLKLSELAAKLELEAEARLYRGKWGEAQFQAHSARLKPGDISMMKRLLDWAIKEKVAFIQPCQELAGKIVEVETDYEPARIALQHLKLPGGWKTMPEAIASIDLLHAPDRLELHKALAATRPARSAADYPADPTKGMERMPDGYFKTATKRAGQPYFVHTRGYKRNEPCALVIGLHGGGEGGLEKSLEYAGIEAASWTRSTREGSWVVISPTVKNHVIGSWWNLENLENTFDAIDETLERFNIDRKRIYLTGQSMGANGTGTWMYAFPEMAAAYCGRAGAYWNHVGGIRDLLGKPVLVIHGEKDEEFRNKSRDEFIRKTNEAKGVVTHISYPDIDHFIANEYVWPKMLPFFLKHTNDIEPDFRLLREVFRERQRRWPHSGTADGK